MMGKQHDFVSRNYLQMWIDRTHKSEARLESLKDLSTRMKQVARNMESLGVSGARIEFYGEEIKRLAEGDG